MTKCEREGKYELKCFLRNFNSVCRDIGWGSVRLFYEKRSEAVDAEVPDRFCGRSYGGGICVESFDSGN